MDLTPKALRMLEVFASRPLDTLTREDLKAVVWPGEFVEDTNITRHVSLIRTCLRRELAVAEPLLTLPKQGYRLNVPVIVEKEVAPDLAAEPLPVPAAETPTQPILSPDPPRRRSMAIFWAVCVMVCAFAAIAVWTVRRFHARPADVATSNPALMETPETNPAISIPSTLHQTPANVTRPALAILDLSSNSRDGSWSWLGTAMREVLWMDFNASEDVKIVNGQNTIDSEVDLNLPRQTYDAALVRQIGKRTMADYAIVGTYRVDDKHIHVELEMMQTRDRVSLDSYTIDATEQTLIPELAKAVDQFRSRLDLPHAATPAGNVLPLEHGFAGLRPFAEGVRKQRLGFPAEAHPLLLSAAKLSPLSPMAHLELSRNAGKIGMPDLAASEAHFAIQVSNALPEETKLYVRARVQYYAGQFSECAEDYRRLVRLRPDDREYKLYLGECYFSNNQSDLELQMLTPNYGLHDPRIDRQMARDAQRLHDWNKAVEYADAQVRDARAIYATAMTANGLVTRARAKVQLGNMQDAVADFQEAISIGENKQLLWELARAYELLGDAQTKLHQPSETLANYRKMLEIWRRLGEKRNVLFSMEQVALAQKAAHDYEGARKTLLEALEYAEATENAKFAADGNLDLAEVSLEEQDMKAAANYAELAFRKAMATNEMDVAAAAQGDLGDVALSRGDIVAARASFLQGLDMATQAKEAELRMRMLKRLVKVENAAGNAAAAGKWQAEADTKLP